MIRVVEEKTILIIQDGQFTAIRKRPSAGLLAGLYELPNENGHLSSEEAVRIVENMDLEALYIEPLEASRHIFSHIEWKMIGYRIRVASVETNRNKDLLFVDKKQSEKQYAIPSAFRAYVKYMKEETK